jgi:hypothetical protein
MQQESERIVLDLQYLPCIEYFLNILKAKEVVFENSENYLRHTYRNRCKILTADKVLELSVPVKHEGKKLYTEVEIDYSQKWLQVHQRAIVSAYRNAPYFEYYWPFFEGIYSKNHISLFDMNFDFLTLCLKLFRIEKNISFTNSYIKEYEGVFDMRNGILPKKNRTEDPNLGRITYKQVFGRNFVNNMSIIDLLFCEGNNAINVINM